MKSIYIQLYINLSEDALLCKQIDGVTRLFPRRRSSRKMVLFLNELTMTVGV